MTFFSIVPRDKGFLKDYSNAIPLKVVQDSGIDTSPNLNINVTDLSKGYKHFYNSGSIGITFKINIIIHKDERVGDKLLIDLLDGYIRSMTPLLVHTDAIDIPNTNNDAYIIVDNNSRKQSYLNYTEWELKFMTYTPLSVFKYANNNQGVLKAINKAKKKSTKSSSTNNSKLAKCNYKVLVYSSKKNKVPCVKYMQKILYKNKLLTKKQVDGWFGKTTKNAVKKFQKKYNKKYGIVTVKKGAGKGVVNVNAGTIINNKSKNNYIDMSSINKLSKTSGNGSTVAKITKILRTDGKVDKATWKALCKS